MIELKTKLSEIKDSNLVFLIEKNTDLKQLENLKLDNTVIEKVQKTTKESKNKQISFFL
jgi:regulator of replication initiation timing